MRRKIDNMILKIKKRTKPMNRIGPHMEWMEILVIILPLLQGVAFLVLAECKVMDFVHVEWIKTASIRLGQGKHWGMK